MSVIRTHSGVDLLIDAEDVFVCQKYRWHIDTHGYAEAWAGGKKRIKLHRLIMNELDNKSCVDHINGNRLDNRKENLRVVSNKMNAENLHKKKKTTSLYFGVCYDNRKNNLEKRWIASIKTNYKSIFLGRYKTPEEAALAYNKKAEELGYLTRNKIKENYV